MNPTSWRDLVCTAHVVLWSIAHQSFGRFLLLQERAEALVELLEDPSINADEDDEFQVDNESEWEALLEGDAEEEEPEDDPFHDVEILEVPAGSLQELFTDFGLNASSLEVAAKNFDAQGMCFNLLRKMDSICEFFENEVDNTELEEWVEEILRESAEDKDIADLLEQWRGLPALYRALREETAFQWLIASEFVSRVAVVGDPAIPTPEQIQAAVSEVIKSRSNGRVNLSSLFSQAERLATSRLNEIARCNSPDAGQELIMFDANGGSLDCNTAANELPKAMDAYRASLVS